MTTGRRWIQNVALGLIGLILLAAGGAPAEADDPNRAALIVVHGSGQTLTRCVSFSESEITGLDLLQRSGLDLNVDASNAVGVAVCRIDQEGCTFPTEACFCQCQGSPCVYWSYWRLKAEGGWTYSNLGASLVPVHNGNVEGWVWGGGTTASAAPPPVIPFEQICPALTAIPPTSTPTPTATFTVAPPTYMPDPPTSTYTARPLTNTPPPTSSTLVQITVTAAPSAPTLPPTATSAPRPAAATVGPTATAGRAILTTPTRAPGAAVGASAELAGATAPPPASDPTTEATGAPPVVTSAPSPAQIAQVAPSATPRPTRSGATSTPILALSQRPTPTPQPADANASPWARMGLIGAIVLVSAGAAGLTLLVLRRAK